MPLIDSTYFKNTNILADVSEPSPYSTIDNRLSEEIIRGEKDVLSYAFGWEMWEDFKEFIVNGEAENTPENYKAIINGKDYEKEGKKCFWLGLIQPETKESLLADYVYCSYREDNVTQTTQTAESTISSKVGSTISATPKIVRTWNQFIEKLHGGFRSNPSGFTLEGNPYWLLPRGGVDYYGVNRKSGPVSLAQFLFDNKNDYPLLDQDYRRFGEFKNEFGI
ncbi:hypothetical protein [Chryseobacterium sp.]|uniref:hypothetical protein n=1 Tax=Chryseobacterium sp. TaxID=1871047 RepID=UPI002898A7B8|nr:hypothetical protein [Chryseobacterium sp.]